MIQRKLFQIFMDDNQNIKCAECNGRLVNNLSCFEQLGQILAWESFDIELGKVHFLTVASYNIQHPSQFADEAIQGLKLNFVRYLENKITIEQILRNTREVYNGSRRIKIAEEHRIIKPKKWSKTISYVYTPDSPQDAAARVRLWANAIKEEL